MQRPYADAQLAVLKLWDGWAATPSSATYPQMQEFYSWLETHHPEVLTFPVPKGVDRWQEVRAWLNKRVGYGKRAD